VGNTLEVFFGVSQGSGGRWCGNKGGTFFFGSQIASSKFFLEFCYSMMDLWTVGLEMGEKEKQTNEIEKVNKKYVNLATTCSF